MTYDQCKKMLYVSVGILILSIITTALGGRFVHLECLVCDENIDSVSYLEYKLGPFEEIPMMHPRCSDYVANTLAANSDMSFGEWLEIRGWLPRAEETTGLPIKDLLEKLNTDLEMGNE